MICIFAFIIRTAKWFCFIYYLIIAVVHLKLSPAIFLEFAMYILHTFVFLYYESVFFELVIYFFNIHLSKIRKIQR